MGNMEPQLRISSPVVVLSCIHLNCCLGGSQGNRPDTQTHTEAKRAISKLTVGFHC